MAKHILVIGATGQTGIDFCHAALKAGHRLTLYIRNPDKLLPNLKENSKLEVIKGTLENQEGLKQAVACGASVFVSFAGPVSRSSGTPVTDCMRLIFPLLISHNYERAMILGTCSFPAPQDLGAWKWSASVALIKTLAGSAYSEFNGLGTFVTSQDVDKIKWTLFRVPFLGNGNAKPVTATFTGTGADGFFLSRKSIANWVLEQMGVDSEWIGKAPVLSN
jgi:hypothetical protein